MAPGGRGGFPARSVISCIAPLPLLLCVLLTLVVEALMAGAETDQLLRLSSHLFGKLDTTTSKKNMTVACCTVKETTQRSCGCTVSIFPNFIFQCRNRGQPDNPTAFAQSKLSELNARDSGLLQSCIRQNAPTSTSPSGFLQQGAALPFMPWLGNTSQTFANLAVAGVDGDVCAGLFTQGPRPRWWQLSCPDSPSPHSGCPNQEPREADVGPTSLLRQSRAHQVGAPMNVERSTVEHTRDIHHALTAWSTATSVLH